MSMLRPLPALVLCAAACTLPGYEGFTSFEPEGGSTTGTPPTPDDPPTTGNGIQTVTGADPGTSSGDGSTGLDETTGEPLPPPPAILGHTLSPNPLTELGTIAVTIVAEHAEGVRMQVDGGDPVELTPAPEGFTGGIPIYSGLSTGPHHATFVAWRGDQQSEPTQVPFEVALPPPGEGYVWESADLIGQGAVAAVAALPPGDGTAVMVEWGTYYPGGQPRCYLRRRDELGAWGPGDFVEINPGVHCMAIDIQAQPDGTLYLLASRKTGNDPRWWLGRIGSWDMVAAPENLSAGDPGDIAHALALGEDKVAVCGARPVQNPIDKLDAAVWVLGDPVRLYDYNKPMIDPHSIDETLRDCAFDGSTLVGVGDAYGWHEGMMDPKRRRHLQLRLNLDSDTFTSHVGAELGAAQQSGANAVAIDPSGLVVTVGYLCDDVCKQKSYLWAHTPDGDLEWFAPLGADLAAPLDVAASPAGYFVLAGAVNEGPWSSKFWIGAFFLGEIPPAWTYVHDGSPGLPYASSVSVSPSGHIYGAGVGKDGYPALTYISP